MLDSLILYTATTPKNEVRALIRKRRRRRGRGEQGGIEREGVREKEVWRERGSTCYRKSEVLVSKCL